MNAEVKIDRAASLDPRPKSAVSTMVGLVGLAGLLAWTAVARSFGMTGPLAALTALVSCAVPMILWSLLVDKVHRGLQSGIERKVYIGRNEPGVQNMHRQLHALLR